MATIKISDLSVGDWIHHDFYEVDMRVKTIYGDTERIIAESNDGHGVTCHLDHFNPIPITPEILEVNGFEPPRVGIGLDTWFWSNNRDMALELRRYVNDKWHLAYQIKDKAQAHLLFPLYHIHELQHIIRLLHIDKEIVMP